ncbi:small GTP-binding protein, putative [Trichomonas vaginalis G3]|uniref:Small GTP-binding protein, putative n=1 Tax=Trichomonas vaginalis (strain ATCC PRA-98 / G3) TaxID=412133 RepID=A2F3B3_TRIV3|nr:retrograde vesicle-mediated transport, Golgi to ER [Trichomonas vaginalis G3]EAY00622.1 small GTP-binding protein, putative [Trichomonas vaginalis G3]KAI5492654.1 retrograde vesicle-mediated transport, Golgi to ER [Trichomonas vaginalis G3]|eukprot:XP_001313551.1 small GTP-binding protein [Trichomonas vaginalis G3]
MSAAEGTPEAKIVLLGATMVGKTTLVTRFITGEFDQSIKSTVGACYASKVVPIDGESIKLQIWDTAGQEKFKNLVPMYFRAAKVAILTFSVCDPESADEVIFWSNNLKQNTPGVMPALFVVANKIDLPDRKVPTEKGQQIAEEVGGEYVEVSAKDGFNIDNLLQKIGQAALKAVKNDAPQPKSQTINPVPKKKKDGCC